MSARSYRRRRTRQALKRRRARKHRRWRWRWFGLGALLVAIAALLRREPQRAQLPEAPSQPPPAVPQPPADIDSSWVAGPAGTLHILERHPDGHLPVLFVHGLGGRAEHWSYQLDAVGPAIRAVALDLPGHGRSDLAENGDYSIPATASAIGAVADTLSLRRIILVGHSLGAAAAIEYAGAHRGRVAGLLLVDPGGDQTRLSEEHRREPLKQLSRNPEEEIPWHFRQLLSGARPEVAERILEDLKAVSPQTILSALEGASVHSPLPALERFDGPTRSLISDLNDAPYSLHHLQSQLSVLRVPEASHWLMMDRPELVWTALIELLEEIEARNQG